MPAVYEHNKDNPLGPDDEDGMVEFLAEMDEPSPWSWDISCEEPPHSWYKGPKLQTDEKPATKPVKLLIIKQK